MFNFLSGSSNKEKESVHDENDDSISHIALRVTQLLVVDTVNVESGSIIGDLNDLYGIISIYGESQEGFLEAKIGRTATQWDVGASAKWDLGDKNWVIRLTPDDLLDKGLKIYVYDENKYTRDTLIGSAMCPLSTLVDKANEEVSLKGECFNDAGQPSGRLKLTVRVEACNGDEKTPVYTISKPPPTIMNDMLSNLPSLPSMPEMPTIAMPTMAMPELPTMTMPELPTMAMPELPTMTMPELPTMAIPSLSVPSPTLSLNLSLPCSEKRHRRLHSEADPTVAWDETNSIITAAVVAILLFWIVLATSHVVRWCFSIVLNWEVPRLSLFAGDFLAQQATISLLLVLAVIHRALGVVSAYFLRRWLRGRLGKELGAYDFHFGWLSLRGLLDRQEVVIGDLVWRNHGVFTQTPYFFYVKEVTLGLSASNIFDFLYKKGTALKIDKFVLDTVEIHFESGGNEKYPLNLWGALGMSKQESERSSGSPGSWENFIKALMHEFLASIIEVMGSADQAFSSAMSMMRGALQSKKAEQLKVGEMDLLLDVRSVCVLDLIVHPLDLLSARHLKETCFTDMHVHHLVMLHKELLKEDQPVTVQVLIGLIQAKLIQVLVAENQSTILAMLSAASANSIASFFTFSR